MNSATTTPAKPVFATLALGSRYRFHAAQLAIDLEHLFPQFRLIVLTDAPQYFSSFPHVQAWPHRQRAVFRCFHDKRFLIQRARQESDACIVIDANIRLLAAGDDATFSELDHGISAAHAYTIAGKWQSDEVPSLSSKQAEYLRKEKQWIGRVLDTLKLSPETTCFPQEYLYAIKSSDDPMITSWLEAWGDLADYFDYHRLTWSEGFGIGIAAAVTGLPLQCVRVLPDTHYYKRRSHLFNLHTMQNPITRAQSLCHDQQELLGRTLEPDTRSRRYRTRLGQIIRYGQFRLKHRSDQPWLDALHRRSEAHRTA